MAIITKTRILLVNPPRKILFPRTPYARWFPLGLAYVAASCRENGFDVQVYDAMSHAGRIASVGGDESSALAERPGTSALYELGARWDKLREVLFTEQPDIVGITFPCAAHRSEAVRATEIAKDALPDCVTVAGGPDVTSSWGSVMANDVVDFGIRGDGELPFKALLESLISGGGLAGIDGLVYRIGAEVRENGRAVSSSDLLDSIIPAYDLFPMERWFALSDMRFAMLTTSRGCASSCAYCSQASTRYRARHVDSVVNEIRYMIDKYDIDTLLIEDDSLLARRGNALRLFESIAEIDRELAIHCMAGVSASAIDQTMARAMKGAGVRTVAFGVETFDAESLAKVNKPPPSENHACEAVRVSREAGIEDTRLFFIAGLPGSTLDKCLADIERAYALGARVNLNFLYPIEGTPLFEDSAAASVVSKAPEAFRSAFVNLSRNGFSRDEGILLIDSYHALKELTNHRNLDKCLQAHGVSRRENGEVDVYLLTVDRHDWRLKGGDKGDGKLCSHFANRLADWFSIAGEALYMCREKSCRMAKRSGACEFELREVARLDDTKARIIESLRRCYRLYKGALS